PPVRGRGGGRGERDRARARSRLATRGTATHHGKGRPNRTTPASLGCTSGERSTTPVPPHPRRAAPGIPRPRRTRPLPADRGRIRAAEHASTLPCPIALCAIPT